MIDRQIAPTNDDAGGGEPPLVLIVEDNSTNARLTAGMLGAAGYATQLATSGDEGLRMARQLKPNLIVTDLQMPGMDGLTMTRALKADSTTASIPVVAVTAHALTGYREEALSAGCCAFIVKPCRFREFLDEIAHVFQTTAR